MVVYCDLTGWTAYVKAKLVDIPFKKCNPQGWVSRKYVSVKGHHVSKWWWWWWWDILRKCRHPQTFLSNLFERPYEWKEKLSSHTPHSMVHGPNITHGAPEISAVWVADRLINLLPGWFAAWLAFGLIGWLQPPLPHHPPVCKRPFCQRGLIWSDAPYTCGTAQQFHTLLVITPCVRMCVYQEERRRCREGARKRDACWERSKAKCKSFGSPHTNSGLHHFFILSQS